MATATVTFRAVSALGCAVAGYSLYRLMVAAECVDASCAPTLLWSNLFLVAGLLIATVGLIGSRFPVDLGLLLMFSSLGAGSIAAGARSPSGSYLQLFGIGFGAVVVLAGVVPVVGSALVRRRWGRAARRPAYGTPSAQAPSMTSELERLDRLRGSGALTGQEFAVLKARLLDE